MSMASELIAEGACRAVVEQRLEVFLVAGPLVGGPQDEPWSAATACGSEASGDLLVGLEDDAGGGGPAAVGALFAMREEAVGHLEEHLLGLGCAVEEHEGERGLEDEVAARLGPAPDAVFGHLAAVVVGGADVAMAGGVDAGEPLEALGGVPWRARSLWGCRS